MTKLEFLDRIVDGWIRRDLERMMSGIPANDGEIGNINLPLALCTLSYMEFLGGYLIGRYRSFATSAKKYIKQCFSNPSEYNVALLMDIYRNGLSHEYFARSGISRENERPALYLSKEGQVVLDVETLTKDFIKSLQVFRTELSDENYLNRKQEIEESIVQFTQGYAEQIQKLPRKKLKKLIPMYNSAVFSGLASTYPGPVKFIKMSTSEDVA